MVREPEQYNLTAIRRVLLRAFNTDDLDDLFYFAATAELRAVRNEYVPSDSLGTKIRKAMDYCERRGLLDQLLVEIEQERPEQAEALQAELHKMREVRQQAEAAERLNARLEELYQQAAAMLERRDWAGGRKRLAQIEELEPGYRDAPELLHGADVQLARAKQADGLMARGKEHLAEGKWWLASQSFRQVLELAPDHAQAQLSLNEARRQEETASGLVKGQNHFRAGRWEEAIACFEAVLAIDPSCQEASQLLGWAQARERARLEEESRQAQQARDARLREEVRQTERTLLYETGCDAAGEKDWSKAITSFEAVLKIDADYLDTADRLARARAAQRAQNEASRQQDRRPAKVKADGEIPQGEFDWSGWASDVSADGVVARLATPEDLQDLSLGDGSLSGIFEQLLDGATGTQEAAPEQSAAPAKPVEWQTVSILKGHARKVCRAALSPDGKWAVTASDDRTARVWEALTGKLVAELQGHRNRVNYAAFSPDGMLVVTASDDGRARLWEARTGRAVAELKPHGKITAIGRQPVVSAAFTPDGKLVATASNDGKVRLWKVTTGQIEAELSGADAFAVRAVCSPGGDRLVRLDKDRKGRVRDVQTGKLWEAMGERAGSLRDLAFSVGGKKAITAHNDGVARIWHVETGKIARVLHVSDIDPLRAVAFHPNGRWVATVTVSKKVKVWNVETGGLVALLIGHVDFVNNVAFSLDGELAVTASDDLTARVWQVPAS
jgi:WD40 repeat protein